MQTITGSAAGVPYTALPPRGVDGRAALIITWHMLDAPRTDAAFAAALPMADVPAWRVHLAMPMCGGRMVDGSVDAVVELARRDAVRAFLVPFVREAAAEFPAVLDALRSQLPIVDGPVGVLGGSLGGAVVLEVLAGGDVPIGTAALVNPAVRLRSVVPYVAPMSGTPYVWTPEAHRIVDDHDYVARLDGVECPSLLVVSGEEDHAEFRRDAADLVDAVRRGHPEPDAVRLAPVPDLAHPLADESGMEPAPQRATARAVDSILTEWFRETLAV